MELLSKFFLHGEEVLRNKDLQSFEYYMMMKLSFCEKTVDGLLVGFICLDRIDFTLILGECTP